MMFRTHAAFGFFIALLFIKFFPQKYPLLFVLLVTLFSSLPDIDTPKSKIGRKFSLISVPLSLLVKHRGITHSIFPVIGLYLLFDYLNLSYLALTIVLGYISHLLGDGVSKEGINILYPFSTISIRGFFRVGSAMETLIFIGLIIANFYLVMKMFAFI